MMVVQRARLLFLFALLAGAASAASPAVRLKSDYELALQTERLTEALVADHPRDVYRMFTPAFAAEHSFASFDSALSRWYRGRRIVRANHKVVDIKGPSGYVSSWFVFEGENDYQYVYQNWLNTGHGWELVWLSRIIDPSYKFGQNDSFGLVNAAEAGLRYLLSKPGLEAFEGALGRPDTVVLLRRGQPGEGNYQLDRPVVWTTPAEMRAHVRLPRTRFLLGLALARVIGDVALVTVDVIPTSRDMPDRKRHARGIEIYLKRAGNEWCFCEVGKRW